MTSAEVGSLFDPPVICWCSGALSQGIPASPNAKSVLYLPENVGIIVTTGNLDTDAALRDAIAHSIKNSKAPLSVKIAREPVSELIASSILVRDTITINFALESRSQVNSVDNAVSLLDGSDLRAGLSDHFRVRTAGSQQFSLRLHRGADLSFLGISHLYLADGGLTPIPSILGQAQREVNMTCSKQELGIPEMVKRELMARGWICRQTIIWAKPNPMPELVRDRCTKAHEYVFLLTKSGRYYFDAEAIAEKVG